MPKDDDFGGKPSKGTPKDKRLKRNDSQPRPTPPVRKVPNTQKKGK